MKKSSIIASLMTAMMGLGRFTTNAVSPVQLSTIPQRSRKTGARNGIKGMKGSNCTGYGANILAAQASRRVTQDRVTKHKDYLARIAARSAERRAITEARAV